MVVRETNVLRSMPSFRPLLEGGPARLTFEVVEIPRPGLSRSYPEIAMYHRVLRQLGMP